jgi:hypothetical protein
MPARVFRLRTRGRKITRQEMIDGGGLERLLIFEHTHAGACVRYHSSASLVLPKSYMQAKACNSLFDPMLARVDADGFILRGYENETIGGVLVQYVQVWLCIPILAASARASFERRSASSN